MPAGFCVSLSCTQVLHIGLSVLDRVMERRRKGRGKAAFLHVPGGTDEASIARGRNIAEAAIRAVVGSWEEGIRRSAVPGKSGKVFNG